MQVPAIQPLREDQPATGCFHNLARVDYNYADKYLAAVTVRRDGSSRFGADNQYGIFPAASVGWRIDKEAFMQNNNFFSELKLRVGVGRVGNQQIGDLARFGLFDTRYGTTQAQLTGGFWEQYYEYRYGLFIIRCQYRYIAFRFCSNTGRQTQLLNGKLQMKSMQD